MHISSLLPLSLLTTSLTLALPLASPQCTGCGPGSGPGGHKDNSGKNRGVNPSSLMMGAQRSTSTTTNTNKHTSPISVRDNAASADETAGVYICTEPAWTGTCEHHVTPLGGSDENCTILPSGASSIGPDPGVLCIFYTNAYCRALLSDGSESLTLSFPGSDSLGAFDGVVRSYHCFREERNDTGIVAGGNYSAPDTDIGQRRKTVRLG